MPKFKIQLPKKQFLTLEEAIKVLNLKNVEELLEFGYMRETPDDRFGKLHIHAIITSENIENASKFFTTYNNKSLSIFDNTINDNNVEIDRLAEHYFQHNSQLEKDFEHQLENEQSKEQDDEMDQFRLDSYDLYHTDVTKTPRNFILLDIETLIQLTMSDSLKISKGFVERLDSRLVELDISELGIAISKKNLRILINDIESFLPKNSSNEIAINETYSSNDKIEGKTRSYLLTMIEALVENYKREREINLSDNVMKLEIEKMGDKAGLDLNARTNLKYLSEMRITDTYRKDK